MDTTHLLLLFVVSVMFGGRLKGLVRGALSLIKQDKRFGCMDRMSLGGEKIFQVCRLLEEVEGLCRGKTVLMDGDRKMLLS